MGPKYTPMLLITASPAHPLHHPAVKRNNLVVVLASLGKLLKFSGLPIGLSLLFILKNSTCEGVPLLLFKNACLTIN